MALEWIGATIGFGVVTRESHTSRRRDRAAADMNSRAYAGPQRLVAKQQAIYAVECQGTIDQFSEALPPVIQGS